MNKKIIAGICGLFVLGGIGIGFKYLANYANHSQYETLHTKTVEFCHQFSTEKSKQGCLADIDQFYADCYKQSVFPGPTISGVSVEIRGLYLTESVDLEALMECFNEQSKVLMLVPS